MAYTVYASTDLMLAKSDTTFVEVGIGVLGLSVLEVINPLRGLRQEQALLLKTG
jgi:hypothetical protein